MANVPLLKASALLKKFKIGDKIGDKKEDMTEEKNNGVPTPGQADTDLPHPV